MVTVAQAMQTFISGLEIAGCEREDCERCVSCDVKRQRDALRTHLEKALSVREFLISGSYKRSTALRPLHDIDLFVVLNRNEELRRSPAGLLKRLQEVLGEPYPNKDKPKRQTHSINVEFSGTGLGFDVVPAFEHESGGYEIPDWEARSWIRTDPPKHVEHSVAANQRTSGKAKPIVKALKRWRDVHEVVLGSFHLELLIYEVLRADPGSFADGIAATFKGLSTRVLEGMPEPAGIGPRVDVRVTDTERRTASQRFAEAAATAARAIEADRGGRLAEAHGSWRALLGSDYPERGTAP